MSAYSGGEAVLFVEQTAQCVGLATQTIHTPLLPSISLARSPLKRYYLNSACIVDGMAAPQNMLFVQCHLPCMKPVICFWHHCILMAIHPLYPFAADWQHLGQSSLNSVSGDRSGTK